MDPMNITEKFKLFLAKYKYVLLVIVAGILLMMIPTRDIPVEAESISPSQQTSTDIQTQLEQILSHMDGVGKAKVLLTHAEGQKILYEANEDKTETDQTSSMRKDIVIIVDENRTEAGLVQQVIPPIYLGAVVVCQGGDKASVKLAVVEAVSNATGLSTDRISVMKMK